jgi:hypothetical protein
MVSKHNPILSAYHRHSVIADDLDEAIFRRISTYDHVKVHQRLAYKRVIGTAQWFLDHPDFKAWLVEKKFSRLWCSGKSKLALYSSLTVNKSNHYS